MGVGRMRWNQLCELLRRRTLNTITIMTMAMEKWIYHIIQSKEWCCLWDIKGILTWESGFANCKLIFLTALRSGIKKMIICTNGNKNGGIVLCHSTSRLACQVQIQQKIYLRDQNVVNGYWQTQLKTLSLYKPFYHKKIKFIYLLTATYRYW